MERTVELEWRGGSYKAVVDTSINKVKSAFVKKGKLFKRWEKLPINMYMANTVLGDEMVKEALR